MPWGTQLNVISGGDIRHSERRTGTERFGPVVAGKLTPDCELVTDITLKACGGISPHKPVQRMEVSLSSFRPDPREGLAFTLVERTGAVLLVL